MYDLQPRVQMKNKVVTVEALSSAGKQELPQGLGNATDALNMETF